VTLPPPIPDAGTYVSPLDGFSELAATYDARMAGSPLLLVESTATLSALPNLAGAVAGDIGCGTGRFALQMARMGAETVRGVDLAPPMLVAAEKKARKVGDLDDVLTWETGDVGAPSGLPLGDEALDVAVCALVLTFTPDLAPAFGELARVLRPGGVLVVSDYHPHGLAEARAADLARGGRDRAPWTRFTSLGGEEWRIAQTPHSVSDYITTAQAAGLTLDCISEPSVDRRLAMTYSGLRDQIGVPLALVLRFVKT